MLEGYKLNIYQSDASRLLTHKRRIQAEFALKLKSNLTFIKGKFKQQKKTS
jgi:hypothetical protein